MDHEKIQRTLDTIFVIVVIQLSAFLTFVYLTANP